MWNIIVVVVVVVSKPVLSESFKNAHIDLKAKYFLLMMDWELKNQKLIDCHIVKKNSKDSKKTSKINKILEKKRQTKNNDKNDKIRKPLH